MFIRRRKSNQSDVPEAALNTQYDPIPNKKMAIAKEKYHPMPALIPQPPKEFSRQNSVNSVSKTAAEMQFAQSRQLVLWK